MRKSDGLYFATGCILHVAKLGHNLKLFLPCSTLLKNNYLKERKKRTGKKE